MGIYDRDYTRTSSSNVPPSTHASRAMGNLRFVSVNTWIIIINVVVFILGNMVFAHVAVRTDAGRFPFNTTTTEQLQHATVDRDHVFGFPNQPGYEGEHLIDTRTGQWIGWQRIAVRPLFEAIGHFSTGKAFLELQVWRFITFQFLHANFMHIFFNMLGLWFVGGLVEQYLGGKRYAAFYLICGVFGAVSYLILNFLGFLVLTKLAPGLKYHIPALLFDDIYTPLIGASAGVFGVLMAAAFIAPNAMVQVMFVFPMRLKVFVYGYVAFVVFNLVVGGNNAGGDAAHVGGIIAGYYFIRHTHLLRDFFEVFGRRSNAPSSKNRPPSSSAGPIATFASEVDRILEKVRQDGLQSLNSDERETLRRASQTR